VIFIHVLVYTMQSAVSYARLATFLKLHLSDDNQRIQ